MACEKLCEASAEVNEYMDSPLEPMLGISPTVYLQQFSLFMFSDIMIFSLSLACRFRRMKLRLCTECMPPIAVTMSRMQATPLCNCVRKAMEHLPVGVCALAFQDVESSCGS